MRSFPHRRARTSRLLLCGAIVIFVGVVITLSATFTASNNVPQSSSGASKQPRQMSQLVPGGCTSLALVSLVAGSGTFSNRQSSMLILGSAGSDTITDTGGGSCIIAGGGANTVIGTTGDICISGPTLSVAGPCPTGSPTTTTTTATTTTTTTPPGNGVTAAPASDNYNNYGGQERLAFSDKFSITAMTVTINVVQTTGVTFNSQSNSFPGGDLNQTFTTSGGIITYSFVLGGGQVIPAGYSNGIVYAQFGGTGSPHSMSGDTWSVTSTSNGIVSNLTGTF